MAKEFQPHGTCKFCGQMYLITPEELKPYEDGTVAGDVPEQLYDELATYKCKCDEARQAVHDQEISEKAKENIRILFEKDFPEVAALMQRAVGPMMEGRMVNISIKIGKHTTASIKRKTSGDISVKSTYTKTDEFET